MRSIGEVNGGAWILRTRAPEGQVEDCWWVEVVDEIMMATAMKVVDKVDNIMVEIYPTTVLLYTFYCTK